MSEPAFDREWRLADLLDTAACEKIAAALAQLLGGDLAIIDALGNPVCGSLHPAARREPLVLELEPLGYLGSATAGADALRAARDLLLALLRCQLRCAMAVALHQAAAADDFASLAREQTRLAEAEARCAWLSEELDDRVRKQVHELGERQQALYLADKLSSVGQLAAGMAHEINNPLAFVRSNFSTFERYLGQIAQLKKQLANAEVAWPALDLDFVLEDSRDLLHDSAQGLERIARIVGELKEFSNVDRAVEEFSDLNECLRQAAVIVEKQLPFGVAIRFRLLPLPGIICLPGHLKQIFFNVIGNAAQAIRDAGRPGEITLSSEADGKNIVIRIRDDGVGMTAEQIEHAFEPFYTQRPVGSGIGLGLATARSVVLAHGGRIALDSRPGAGTTVTLFFPLPS